MKETIKTALLQCRRVLIKIIKPKMNNEFLFKKHPKGKSSSFSKEEDMK
jgi:hypothetical protein